MNSIHDLYPTAKAKMDSISSPEVTAEQFQDFLSWLLSIPSEQFGEDGWLLVGMQATVKESDIPSKIVDGSYTPAMAMYACAVHLVLFKEVVDKRTS